MLKNILSNPSLEGDYTERGAPELKIAPDWSLFFRHNEPAPDGPQDSEHYCGRPEYKPMLRSQNPTRVLAGDKSQCAFIRWRVMDACILQRLQVPVGRMLTLRAHVQGWCSSTDDPAACDGELYFALGLDLMGDINPFSPMNPSSVIWSDWQRAAADWQQLELQAQATHPYATAIVRFWNKYRYAHNDAYIDNLQLLVEQDDPLPPDLGTCVTRDELASLFLAAAASIALPPA